MDLPDQKKRILYIITQPSPWGGAQRYVYDLATVLHHDGWPITVAIGENVEGELCQKLKAEGVPVRHLTMLTRAVRPLKNFRAMHEIRALCVELKPDIVHLNSSMAGVVGALGARLAGVQKIVYTVHGLVTKEPLPLPAKLAYWCAEWIAGKFRDTTICVSEDDRRAVIAQHIAPAQRTVTIPIGIDPNIPFLLREAARKKLSSFNLRLDTNQQWIGTIAGLYQTKGIDTLIDAVSQLIRVRADGRLPLQFIIIGDGPERERLQKRIEAKKLTASVFLVGALPDAARCMKAFDCFVLPSVKEGMPYAILEALIAGVPIIASAVGGIPELVHSLKSLRSQNTEASPTLVPARNAHALAEAIEAATTQERGVRPLSEITTFTLSRMVQRTLTEYSL